MEGDHGAVAAGDMAVSEGRRPRVISISHDACTTVDNLPPVSD